MSRAFVGILVLAFASSGFARDTGAGLKAGPSSSSSSSSSGPSTTGSPHTALEGPVFRPAPPQAHALTLAEAEQRALDRNPAIAQARLGTQAASYAIAEGRAAYSPTFTASLTQRGQTNPATSQLAGGQQQVTTDASTYASGVSQALPWGGGRVSLDFTGSRTATSNVFSTYNPSFTSGVTAAVTQPLLRGLRVDATRAAIAEADIASDIADADLRQQVAVTLAGVRRAYWELVYATDAVATARRSEALAQQQLDDNRRRVEVGTVAPLDLVEAEAEVASRHQAVVQAEGVWRGAQVALKQLLVASATDPIWEAAVEPVDRPDATPRTIDVSRAIATAVANRSDVQAARLERQSRANTVRLLDDQRKPAVDLVAQYSLNGIGGTQVLRQTGTLGSEVIGTVPGSYLDVLRSIGALDYPTWTVGVNVTMPLGRRAADAAYARAQVQQRQDDVRIQALELTVAAQITRLGADVRSAEEVIRAAAAARVLAQKRLEAEEARRAAGLSTNFLVLQAQRDLATAQTNELRAQLDYRTALVDFDLAQTAPL
jgi:outer membrane protein TolC